jgi:hypothetical protein
MKWYYTNNDKAEGPFSLEEILPSIQPNTLVWREESLEEWIEASKHPLLQNIFNLSKTNQNSMEEISAGLIQAEASITESKTVTPYEINLVLNTNWKTKGFGSRGTSYLYVDNNFIQKVSHDGFNVKVKTEKENPLIQFVTEECYNNGMDQDSVEFWLLEFPNDIIEIVVPKFDCINNYRIDIDYGDRKPSFFGGGDMGIMPNPKTIQPY